MTEARELIDADEVAALTGMSPRNVYRQADAGRLPRGVKIGGLRRWSRTELMDWIKAGCKPATQPRKAAPA